MISRPRSGPRYLRFTTVGGTTVGGTTVGGTTVGGTTVGGTAVGGPTDEQLIEYLDLALDR
jgi:hypothetical protein